MEHDAGRQASGPGSNPMERIGEERCGLAPDATPGSILQQPASVTKAHARQDHTRRGEQVTEP
jgi:hypothetical protein